MGRYSYSQPSSSSLESYNSRSRTSGQCGVPTRCFCGGDVVLKSSADPVRMYYTCADEDDGGHHIFKWWDEAMLDELKNIQTAMDHQESRLLSFTLRDDGECVDPRLMWQQVNSHDIQLTQMREKWENVDMCMGDLKECVANMKPHVACGARALRFEKEVKVMLCIAVALFLVAHVILLLK